MNKIKLNAKIMNQYVGRIIENGISYPKPFYDYINADLIKLFYDLYIYNLKELCKYCEYTYINNSTISNVKFFNYRTFDGFEFSLDDLKSSYLNCCGFYQCMLSNKFNDDILITEGQHRIQVLQKINNENQLINPEILCISLNTFSAPNIKLKVPIYIFDKIFGDVAISKKAIDNQIYEITVDNIQDADTIIRLLHGRLDYAFEKHIELVDFKPDYTIINKLKEE